MTEDDERRAFEAARITTRLWRCTEPGYEHQYGDVHTQFAWRGWLARALLTEDNPHEPIPEGWK